MPRHPLAKIRALLAYLETIKKYALHKKPATAEEALIMLELIAGIAEEGIEEEAAAPTEMKVA
jgi:hypothetical protein